jgi:hypothetical protein
MILIALVTICFLACGFLLYVLFQWTRETKRKPASRPTIGDEAGKAGEKKQPYLGSSRKAAGSDRRALRSRGTRSMTGNRKDAVPSAVTANGMRTRKLQDHLACEGKSRRWK